ncbi:MFS transporter [Streptomyces sulfonofaciens]|uniref:MFS transporter n=1 Tax=Streptomyces sulfonofaciens TaxID=68272 RepID=A0A919GMS6_9ACTN|nr:MFS transporter [Streptomyces sulfonofaciens]GHH87514.1 MFS transporter [Streptomyces sulfonofaciens]
MDVGDSSPARPLSGIPVAAPAPDAPRRAGAGPLLLAMCLGLMLSMLNSTLVNVTMPQIGTSLHTSVTGLQWVADIYTLGYASLLLPGGALGNRLGRRTAFLLGVSAFLVGSLLCALSPTTSVLLASRVIQAVGTAVMVPQTLSIVVSEYTEPTARARAVGIWAGVAGVGLAAGPVLGGLALALADWRAGFFLVVALAVVTLVLGHRVVPAARHGRPGQAPRLDPFGIVLGVLTLTALVYGLIESGTYGWGSPRIIGALVLAAAGSVLFLGTERYVAHRGGSPLMPLELWRIRGFVAANAAGLAYFVTLFGVLFFYSLYLQQQQGHSALATGLLFLPLTACMAAFAPVAGRLTARLGGRSVLVTGLLVAAAGCLALAAETRRPALWDLEWRLSLVGAGCGLMSSTMSNVAVSSVRPQHVNTAAALHNTCRQIGAALGIALLGAVLYARQQAALAAPLDRLGGPARAAVATAVRAGRVDPGAGAGIPAATRRAVADASYTGFTTGLHTAMLVCAVTLLVCAVLNLLLLRARRPRRPQAG